MQMILLKIVQNRLRLKHIRTNRTMTQDILLLNKRKSKRSSVNRKSSINEFMHKSNPYQYYWGIVDTYLNT